MITMKLLIDSIIYNNSMLTEIKRRRDQSLSPPQCIFYLLWDFTAFTDCFHVLPQNSWKFIVSRYWVPMN